MGLVIKSKQANSMAFTAFSKLECAVMNIMSNEILSFFLRSSSSEKMFPSLSCMSSMAKSISA